MTTRYDALITPFIKTPHELLHAPQYKNIALCSYVPKKKKVVVLISTGHYNCAVDSSKPSQKPFQILDYNMYKSGVDTMDQMVGGYACKQDTNRWPLALF